MTLCAISGMQRSFRHSEDKSGRFRNLGANVEYNWDAGWNVVNLATASRKEDNCGNLTVTYVHDPGKVVGTILARIEGDTPASGTYRYYCQDIIGSTRRVRNVDGSSYASYEYTPYGQVYDHSGSDVRHRFTGQEWDETADLYYFPFRYYSPSSARWTTRDPITSANLYTYVAASPLTYVDPWGLIMGTFQVGILTPEDTGAPDSGPPGLINIAFKLPRGCGECEQIRFVQATQKLPWGKIPLRWHLDTSRANRPYYPGPPGGPRGAIMEDNPGFLFISGNQLFETCAVCAKGKDQGKVYGCLTWSARTLRNDQRRLTTVIEGVGSGSYPAQAPSDIFMGLVPDWISP